MTTAWVPPFSGQWLCQCRTLNRNATSDLSHSNCQYPMQTFIEMGLIPWTLFILEKVEDTQLCKMPMNVILITGQNLPTYFDSLVVLKACRTSFCVLPHIVIAAASCWRPNVGRLHQVCFGMITRSHVVNNSPSHLLPFSQSGTSLLVWILSRVYLLR